MKMIRVVIKGGIERFTPLEGASSCAAWYHDIRIQGGVHGNNWCCPFASIEFCEIIEMQEQEQEVSEPQKDWAKAVGSYIGSGLGRPLGEA